MDSLPDVGKNEINVVNQQLVSRLKSTDTAFSLGVYSPPNNGYHSLSCRAKCIWHQSCTVWVKKFYPPPPEVFWIFFPNGWELLIKILHACYSFILTLNCKMLFNYPQLWQSYAVLSATTQWIFTLLCTVQEWRRLACTVYGLVAVSSCHVQCVLCTVQDWRRLACTVYGLVAVSSWRVQSVLCTIQYCVL